MIPVRSPWRRRLIVAVLVGLAVNLVMLGAWTAPRLVQERDLLGRAAVLERDVAQERARATALRERLAAVRANVADARLLLEERLAPRETGLLPLLEEVEASARAAGLKLTSRDYSEEQLESLPVNRVRITLPADGTYRQLVDFVQRLERSDRFLVVERVQLREQGSGTGGQLDVVLSAFFRASPESGAGA